MSPASSRLRWLWRAPARALGRARDYYIRSITGCARYVPNDAAFGAYPVMVPTELPRSQSYGPGGEEDLRDLIRASSERRDDSQRQAVARSQSTAVGRSMAPIDEDAPIEFAGGVGTLYPRSQSYAGGRPPRFPRKEAVLAC
uniref:Uncharacterized protein n=1 Tax=Avena sativa TaxID=4498 RepID=A0ACD5X832_AVESA